MSEGGGERGRLEIHDTMRAARQFLAMISDQFFWPAMLTPDSSVSDRDTNQAVEEAVLTLMARYEVAQDSKAQRVHAPSVRVPRSSIRR